MPFPRLLLLLALGCAPSALFPATAPSYQLTDLGLTGNYAGSQAVAVANSGNLVAGNLLDHVGLPHAFISENGTMTILPVPSGYVRAQAVSMNNQGEIVGLLSTNGTIVHAFSYSNGATRDLGTLQNTGSSYACAVSDSGTVVGASTVTKPLITNAACLFPSTSLGVKAGFSASECYSINSSGQVLVGEQGANGINLYLYAGGNLTSLSIAAAAPSANLSAYVINNSGQFIGTLLTNHHPFASYKGATADLSAVIGPAATLSDINNSGAIVGANQGLGFVYLGGTTYYLGRLTISGGTGWALQTATGINDSGQITGTGINPSDHLQHAYLLTQTGGSNPPALTTQPANITIKAKAAATFKLVAKSYPGVLLTYRWQQLPLGAVTWANLANNATVSGALSTTLSVLKTTAAMNGYQYRCIVTNSGGTTTSKAAKLQVNTPPVIIFQPEEADVTIGTSFSFDVVVSGFPPPTYQWQRLPAGTRKWANVANNAVYSGATTASLFVTSPTQAMSGDQFKCIIKNSQGTVTTIVVALNIIPPG